MQLSIWQHRFFLHRSFYTLSEEGINFRVQALLRERLLPMTNHCHAFGSKFLFHVVFDFERRPDDKYVGRTDMLPEFLDRSSLNGIEVAIFRHSTKLHEESLAWHGLQQPTIVR